MKAIIILIVLRHNFFAVPSTLLSYKCCVASHSFAVISFPYIRYSIVRKSLNATPSPPRSIADNSSLLEKAIACNRLRLVRAANLLPGYTSAHFRCNRGEDLSSTTALQLYREIYGWSVCIRHSSFAAMERKNVGKEHFYDPSPIRFTLDFGRLSLVLIKKGIRKAANFTSCGDQKSGRSSNCSTWKRA